MKNITNKDLQRMIELMGNKKPINESVSNSSLELRKKSANGKTYGIVRENKKYFIKESVNGVDFDFMGGVANKTKNQFHSYEEAVKILNLMFEDINRSHGIQEGVDVLTSDLNEDKKFVIKTKKKKPAAEPKEKPADDFDFGGGEDKGSEGDDAGFDFGGEDKGSKGDDAGFDFGDEGDSSKESNDGFDFGDESSDTETDQDFDMDDTGDDSIKKIQKMTGKLGQKLRDTEDLSSDTMKWVAKSVLSALDLDEMDNEDKKDIIRTIKKKKGEESSDEEFDFMDDEEEITDEFDMDNDTVDWNTLGDDEKTEFIRSYHGDSETPMMDWDEEIDDTPDYENDEFRRGTDDQYLMFPPEEVYKDYMDEDNPNIGGDEDDDELLLDDEMPYYDEDENENYPGMHSDWMSDYMDRKNPRMMPQPAPSKPQTQPGPDVKPGRPDTDKPSPSKKPFTAPPFIKPGDDPNPKAWRGKNMEDYGTNEGTDYMEDYSDEDYDICPSCKGKGGDRTIGFGAVQKPCITCAGEGRVHRHEENYEVDEPYTENPRLFGDGSNTLPKGMGYKYQYKEKFRFPFGGGDVDYMSNNDDNLDPRTKRFKSMRNPAPAPSKPQTQPGPDVKPGRPDTDKPSPSKKPFTAPPFIKPGDDPNPKAWRGKNRNMY